VALDFFSLVVKDATERVGKDRKHGGYRQGNQDK
jgi:hypothetical protein